MIYECTAQKHHFVIEWDRPERWGVRHETKWVANCQGVPLTRGATAETVLRALLSGECKPTLDGADPAALGLPAALDGWSTSRPVASALTSPASSAPS